MTKHIQQFEALFNYATIGMVVTDKDGMILNFNSYAETQFGYTKNEVVGKSVEILMPVKFHHSHTHLRENFYDHPRPRKMGEGRDLHAQRKDGSEFPVEISLSNYLFEGELFVIAFIIDITVRKKSEAIVLEQRNELERVAVEIKKLNAELEHKVDYRTRMLRETLTELEKSKKELNEALEKEKELNELKSRFVTTASHEFRTPLSTILSSSFLLEKYNEMNEPAKRARHIERIKSAVADMKSILEDFLSLGKLEEGIVKVNLQECSAGEVFGEIDAVVADLKLMQKHGQQLNFTYNGNGILYFDKHLFRHIVANLVQNAIKFSPENGTILINAEISGTGLLLTVKDNGIGISEEDQGHLFERFFRAKNALNIQGTGLGLHIVMKYLELMNGSIALKSALNEGSAFTVFIPKNN
ncbi:MAG: PAS domain-containing sensor histidine kinase [Bacteroidetes bacterium]|nr:PAS domain-containing sensor histidine kinase [Bacteroidota bacterium]